MSANTQPRQHTGFSVSSAGGHGIDREPVAANIPATVSRLEPAVDDCPIRSQGSPITAEQPSLASAGSRSESQPSAPPRVHAPFWKVWWKEMLCIMASIASFIGKQARVGYQTREIHPGRFLTNVPYGTLQRLSSLLPLMMVIRFLRGATKSRSTHFSRFSQRWQKKPSCYQCQLP